MIFAPVLTWKPAWGRCTAMVPAGIDGREHPRILDGDLHPEVVGRGAASSTVAPLRSGTAIAPWCTV
jgi:hypothetical protein